MPGKSADDFFRRQAADARGPEAPRRRGLPRRRAGRIALAAGTVLAVAVIVAAGGTLFAAHHLVASVQRIHGIVALDAAHQPLMPAATRKSMTVLLTSSGEEPGPRGGSGADGAPTGPEGRSGLIALVHLNANHRGGSVVSIPPNTVVAVPGHGSEQIWNALPQGGPSLLIQTVENLTNVRIDHYSVLDFDGVRNVVATMHGVDVRVPFTVHSQGFTFRPGINHLTAASVLPYVRQSGVSQVGRSQLQSNLIRAILDKISNQRLFSDAKRHFGVLEAMARAVSVDSNFTDAELVALGMRLSNLGSGEGVFITTPTTRAPDAGPVVLRQPMARQLWKAIRTDSVAAYARRFPFTVTPGAPA